MLVRANFDESPGSGTPTATWEARKKPATAASRPEIRKARTLTQVERIPRRRAAFSSRPTARLARPPAKRYSQISQAIATAITTTNHLGTYLTLFVTIVIRRVDFTSWGILERQRDALDDAQRGEGGDDRRKAEGADACRIASLAPTPIPSRADGGDERNGSRRELVRDERPHDHAGGPSPLRQTRRSHPTSNAFACAITTQSERQGRQQQAAEVVLGKEGRRSRPGVGAHPDHQQRHQQERHPGSTRVGMARDGAGAQWARRPAGAALLTRRPPLRRAWPRPPPTSRRSPR